MQQLDRLLCSVLSSSCCCLLAAVLLTKLRQADTNAELYTLLIENSQIFLCYSFFEQNLWHQEVFNDNTALPVNRNGYSIRQMGSGLLYDFVNSDPRITIDVFIVNNTTSNILFVVEKLFTFHFI